LIGLLNKDREYIEGVFQKTGYSNEVTFEEFFMWWYHFIYTRATNILAEKNYITIPEQGNFFYARDPSVLVQSSSPTTGPTAIVSPEVQRILDRYVEAVGGKAALMRLSTENRKGELRSERAVFVVESHATAPGYWAFKLKNDQRSLSIQCHKADCWRNGDQSDLVDPATSVQMAAEFEMHFPLHLKEYFSTLQLNGSESQPGASTLILEGSSPRLGSTKIVFDAQTGLLLRLGTAEFHDYRECDGIKRPFTFISTADGKVTFNQTQHNQPIPADVFELQSRALAQGNPN